MDHDEFRSRNAWQVHRLLIMVAHLFIICVRQSFKTDQPILTIPMAQSLMEASLRNNWCILKVPRSVQYHLKRNDIASRSHRKTKLRKREEQRNLSRQQDFNLSYGYLLCRTIT